jgi:DDE family transposase
MLDLARRSGQDLLVPKRGGAMHVATTRRHYVGKDGQARVYETHLLRRSFRDGEKVRNETLANLSHLPAEAIAAIRAVLAGDHLVVAGDGFVLEQSRPHGHVAAVHAMARRLGFPGLLGEPGRMRDVAFALLIARVVRPGSKLATRRWWADTTLAADLGVADASRDEVYAALDWLAAHQDGIETRLAARHLAAGGLALFDLSSSWVTGRRCPLAAFGYSRDARRDHPQITYGLLTDPAGRPVAVRVFPGNTGDPTAFTGIPALLRDRFGLSDIVIVGDRGMLTTARIDALRALGGFGWVTALRAPAVAALAADDGPLQLSLFDQQNLAEITHPDYPGERLVCCHNPAQAAQRARKRGELLDATDAALARIAATVQAGRLADPIKIGIRVGKAIGRHKMAKHFTVDVGPGHLAVTRDQAAIDAEAALDGIYVLRTSVPAEQMTAADVVRAYKNLANVERDFRSLKTIDLDLRPIHHHTETRVRAHVFLCALAGYLTWHLREQLAPLTFTDEQPPERTDPVAPAHRSPAAQHKAATKTTTDGGETRSFRDLLDHLGTLTRNTVAVTIAEHTTRFEQLTAPTHTQQRAFELLQTAVPLELK